MHRSAWLLLVAACGRYGFSNAPGTPVPDGTEAVVGDSVSGFGTYTITDSTAPYTLLTGTVVAGFVPLADDENYTAILPFTFTYYGIPYTSLTISMNGYVTFETPVTGADTQVNDCPLDATTPGATIALFWDDLYANNKAPSTGNLSYAFSGVAPARSLAIEWRDMDAFYPAGTNSFSQGVRVTQMLVLHEDGSIEMHYGPRTPPVSANKDCGADRHRGCSATIGLEASGSQLFKNVQCGTSSGPGPGYTPIDEGRLFTFTPG